MPLQTGTRLGPYEIVAPLGAGGMGEVYRASDTKLKRDVALKVLPEAVAKDAERMARFQREAQVLASLNHPGIASIYGLEESGGVRALVMELVEGPTLAERIAQGPIPLEEALPIAKQIAEALEFAHEKGIIHRDLKPANIKVTHDGAVKVLDFGLAKALADDPAVSDASNSPTLSMAATKAGIILGTAAYMSPEQARGKAADRRADIWSFGVVLYELLTGKMAFHGETVSDTLAAVIRAEPDWSALPADTPGAVRKLLARCLQKDSKLRLQAIGEARIAVEETISGAPGATAESGAVPPAAAGKGISALGRRPLMLALGALLIGAAIAALITWNLRPALAPASKPVSRFVITLPASQRFTAPDQTGLAISPDGSQLAYVAIEGGIQRLYLRAMDSLESRSIPDTEGAINPFFSPDGQWLGFFTGGRLKKVSVNGGAMISLSQVSAIPRGATWGSQGTVVLGMAAGRLQQVPEAGGILQPLGRMEKGEFTRRWPEFLPGGQAVLFTTGAAASSGEIAVVNVGSGERHSLIQAQGITPALYASSGHIVFAQNGNLMAVPFDPQRLEVKGAAVPMLEGVRQSVVTGATQFSLSATGTLVYLSGAEGANQSRLVWVDRKGTEQPLAAPPRYYETPRLSPDGRRIAVSMDGQIWIYDIARETLTRFTFEGNTNNRPVWTPDGKRLAFYSNREGPTNIYWQRADGSGGLERLTTSDFIHIPASFSPDGQLLAYHEANPATSNDIFVLRLSDRKSQPFLQTPNDEAAPRFSPDGRWLSYVSNESGRNEVYVQPYPGPGGKWQISTEGGTEAVWNPRGGELFFRSGNKIMVVDATTKPGFAVGKPRMLFEGPYVAAPLPIFFYDVSGDGQRFLMIKPAEQGQEAPTQINVVLNWFEELKRRVPTEKK